MQFNQASTLRCLFFVVKSSNIKNEIIKLKNMLDRGSKKRAIIVFVFVLIIFLLGYFLYQIITPDPTCFDGKKNQNEKGIDCGGVCPVCSDVFSVQELNIIEKKFVYGGNNTYDGLIRIENPNNTVGASSFKYTAKLLDENGEILGEKQGQGFILPAETKYITLIGFAVGIDQNPVQLEFEISQPKWEEFSQYQKPQLSIYNKRFTFLTDRVGSEIYGIVKNESRFDFNVIKVNIILRDENNSPVALNSTKIDVMRSGEERDFSLIFPYQIQGEVKNIEIEAEADTYDSQNFIKTYISDERLPFQEY